MHLFCPQCHAQIDADNANLDSLVAKCSRCHAIFRFAEQLGWPDKPPVGQPTAPLTRDTPRPEQIELIDTNIAMTLRWRWYSTSTLGLAFFTLVWNGFLIFWYAMALSMGAWDMALFGTIHLAVGLGLLYSTLTKLFNKTTLSVTPSTITLRHGPLPWPGTQLAVHTIAQFYTQARLRRSKRSVYHTYAVHAVTNDGSTKLLGGLRSPNWALYIEQELERFLHIADQPVRGELPR